MNGQEDKRNNTDIKPGQGIEAMTKDLDCPRHSLCLGVVSRLRSSKIPKRLLSIKEAACYLGRSEWTIAEMVRSGRLPYIPDGKRRFLDIQDLNEWIENSKRRNLD